MGQYYVCVNLDKRQYLFPHRLGAGLKLMEFASHGYECPSIPQALCLLLAASNGRGGGDADKSELVGSWAGDRIAIVGDYAGPFDYPHKEDDHDPRLVYFLCREPSAIAERKEMVLTDGSFEDEERALWEAIDPEQDAYRDISEDVARLLEHEFAGKFVGDGWRQWMPNG